MKTQILTASLATLLFAPPALAADPIVPVAPAPAPVASAFAWDGFYAGVNAGYGWGEAYDDAGVVANPATGGLYDDIDGWLGGVQAGYNYDFGGFVLGVEGDIQLSGMTQTVSNTTVDVDYFGTVRARLGAPVGDALAYVTGGLAYGSATIDNTAGGGDTDSNFHVGWTVGAGLEYAVSETVSLKGEYLYTDLGQRSYTLAPAPAQDAGVRFHTARVGLNFHF